MLDRLICCQKMLQGKIIDEHEVNVPQETTWVTPRIWLNQD